MRRQILGLGTIALLSLSISACSNEAQNNGRDADVSGVESLMTTKQSIINGDRVSGKDYNSTVSIFIQYGSMRDASCTGTLIAPNYVLTASHCISDCIDHRTGKSNDVSSERPYMRVGIGNSVESLEKVYEIAEFIAHPNFVCSPSDIRNDVALLRLKQHVPSSVAVPVAPLPDSLQLTAQEAEQNKIQGTHVGFGLTNPNNDYSSGVKYKADDDIIAVCPLSGTQSSHCRSVDLPQGFIYSHMETKSVNTCRGDSGGPFFVERDGTTYVAGITSWGEEGCQGWGAMTNVTDYYRSFILPNTGTAIRDEICDDGVDNNDDGRIDCKDPQCQQDLFCQPEICNDGIDNNGNELVDCKDPQCKDSIYCQPEICNDGTDNNANGLVDCADPQCKDSIYCQPEICNDGIDNNENELVDCKDPQCEASIYCQPEDCFNGIDDNGDGLIDCQDPLCSQLQRCQPEICNDGIDNNGNGLIDCKDPQCFKSEYCAVEICDDGIDNNGNGLIDCQDIQCATKPICMKEICNDGTDNNGDGLIDCDDPQCANASACKVASNCSATPIKSQHSPMPLAFILGLGIAIGVARRKKTEI